MADETLDLLIVGAGPAGLLAALIASQLGLSFEVIERRSGMHPEPSAHVLKTHTMEVYRRVGVADAVFAESTPTELQKCVAWCESLEGLCYGQLNLEGKKGDVPRFRQISPVHAANVPQNVVEPLLHERLKTVAGSDPVRFGHSLLGFEQDQSEIRATVEVDGGKRIVRARYILGADGAGSTVRRSAGIAMAGPPVLAHFLAIHIRSDARPLLKRFPGVVFFIRQPGLSGFFIMHQPVGSQVFMLRIDPAVTPLEEFDHAKCREIMDRVIGGPHDYEISSIGDWVMSAQIAERYRAGRAFLIGDAGHRFPPTGGLGLNTGVEDVENLIWKLNAVIRGQADDALLESYEVECRPIAIRNTEQSVKNNDRMQIIETTLGAGQDDTTLQLVIDELKANPTHPRFASLQAAVDEQIDHFALLELDMAARFRGGAFIPPEREVPTPVPEKEGYIASLAPGGQVPHFWLEPGYAALDSLRFDALSLFVPEGTETEWTEVVRQLGDLSLPIQVIALSGAMRSERASVADYWGGDPFAFLVRPDGRIAWVEPKRMQSRIETLREVLTVVNSGKSFVLESLYA